MKVLFVVGACLKVNSSANLCHLAYISGCKKNGAHVDVISMGERGCKTDSSIVLPKIDHWFLFDPPVYNNLSVSTAERLQKKQDKFSRIKKSIKKIILKFYGVYGRTATHWLKKASKFESSEEYDYVISLATPYISHKLADILIGKKKIKYKKWIQIWEDPWTADLYNLDAGKNIKKEEGRLLSHCDIILYVSPLTMQYQKTMFPQYAQKMCWMTLPYYYKKAEENERKEKLAYSIGYFGDYFTFSRNLKPFYDAACQKKIRAFIYGNSDVMFESTELIDVKPRVNLDVLSMAERQTDILVFLCNLRGGQIPGKLYQYSATNKKILFILDGTEKEIHELKCYFQQFNRYVFCNNTTKSIETAIDILCQDEEQTDNVCIEEFSPENTIKKIFNISMRFDEGRL